VELAVSLSKFIFAGKNNVCVHPPALLRQDHDVVHYPGYLSISVHVKNDITNDKPSLLLSWIPNTTLRASPWTVEKRCSQPGASRFVIYKKSNIIINLHNFA